MQFPQDRIQEAIIALCTRTSSAKEVADKYGVNRNLCTFGKTIFLERIFLLLCKKSGKQKESSELGRITEYETADTEIAQLKNEIQRLLEKQRIMNERLYKAHLEYDASSKATELLKKQTVKAKRWWHRENIGRCV